MSGVLTYAEFLVASLPFASTFEATLFRAIAFAARYGGQDFNTIGAWSHWRLQRFNEALSGIIEEEARSGAAPSGD